VSQPLLDRPGRIAVVGVILAGIGLSLAALVASLVHQQPSQALAYVAVSVVLAAIALLVWRGVRWITVVCLIGLAGQIVAAAGILWELTHPADTTKSAQLRSIGIDPTAAEIINLIYSAAAFGVFCWWAARRRSRIGTRQRVDDVQ
jgi:hypothetical protein